MEYKLLSNYSAIMISGTKKLVRLDSQCENGFLHVVPIEDMFDICYEVHVRIGHGMRDRMQYELKSFWNITRTVISLFLESCRPCVEKRKKAKRGVVVKPIVSSALNSRMQIDLIDYSSRSDSDGDFNYCTYSNLQKI